MDRIKRLINESINEKRDILQEEVLNTNNLLIQKGLI